VSLGSPFIELSASEDVSDVTEAFHSLCRDIVEFKRRSRTFFGRVFGAFGREKVSSWLLFSYCVIKLYISSFPTQIISSYLPLLSDDSYV